MKTVQENLIEWDKGDDYALCTFSRPKFINRVKKLKEQFPDEVEIIKENHDGSVLAKVPVDWVFIRRPKQVELTEERKAELREQLQRVKEGRM